VAAAFSLMPVETNLTFSDFAFAMMITLLKYLFCIYLKL
jgi:hypothetical protein